MQIDTVHDWAVVLTVSVVMSTEPVGGVVSPKNRQAAYPNDSYRPQPYTMTPTSLSAVMAWPPAESVTLLHE